MLKAIRENKGFTLIELLVVIAIIAILAAVAAPMVLKQIEKSRVSNTITNYKAVKTAIDQHYADTFKFPEKMKGLVENGATAPTTSTAVSPNGDKTASWNGPYIEKDITGTGVNKFGGDWAYVVKAAKTDTSDVMGSGTVKCDLPGIKSSMYAAYLIATGITANVADKLESSIDGNGTADTAGSFCYDSGKSEGYFWLGDNR